MLPASHPAVSLFRDAVIHQRVHAPNQQIINFKLGDPGIANLAQDIKPESTLANWMLPPESLEPAQFGVMDRRIDIYHCGLLFLQILLGRELFFSKEEILNGAPRQIALQLPAPYSVALEKALRRTVEFRTASAKELWKDLNSPVTDAPALPLLSSDLFKQ